MMRILLETAGHIVIEESDGLAAVQAIEREHPDVAFIDIGLPVMTGYEVARKIRENSSLDDVVLVALTGYGTGQDVSEARAAGFDHFLIKPIQLDKLKHLLDLIAGQADQPEQAKQIQEEIL